MAKQKSAARLDREIAEVLAKKTTKQKRRHHVSRGIAADDWDVAMDAILERDPKRAAEIVRKIREEHGETVQETQAFKDAVLAAPVKVRKKFHALEREDQERFIVDRFKPGQHAISSYGLGKELIVLDVFPKAHPPTVQAYRVDKTPADWSNYNAYTLVPIRSEPIVPDWGDE